MRKVIEQRKQRPSAEILEGFRGLLKIYSPSCVVADAQERAGVMRSYIKSLTPDTKFVGPALTVRLEPGNQADCLDALSVAEDGASLWSRPLVRRRPRSGAVLWQASVR